MVEKLSVINEYPYTELVAPAGFGKTITLRDFINKKQADCQETLFLLQTVQEGEEAWFWEDFSLLFEPLDSDFSRSIKESGLSVDQSGKRNFMRGMEKLLLRLSKRIVFVIDLCSYVPDVKIRDFLEYSSRGQVKISIW